MPDEEIEVIPDDIAKVEPAEYALAFNPAGKYIHFGAEDPEQLTFTASVYSVNGMFVKSFVANERCSVAELPQGVYVVVWNAGGIKRSAKLRIQ